jgi:AAA15 family ATPase/GTPase
MLHKLEIENFYSIRDHQIIDLTTTYIMPNEPNRFASIFSDKAIQAPKIIALYGPNASGKSTVLRAISFIAWFIRNSFQLPPEGQLPYSRFLNKKTVKKPTRLAVTFSAASDFNQLDNIEAPTCKYEYELILGIGKNNQTEVVSEVLNYWPLGKQKHVIQRNGSGDVSANREFSLAGYTVPLKNVLRKNVSVISTLAQLKHPFATFFWNVSNQINSNIVIQKQEHNDFITAQIYKNNPEILKAVNQNIERIDFGIQEMEVKSSDSGIPNPFITIQHNGLDEPINFSMESQGTRHFIHIFPLIFQALETGGLAVIDDMDISIHPLILPEIVRWFHDSKRNPRNAQLWMTCQSPSLLSELVKEEIVFCQKSTDGCSSVYGLTEIKDVRRDDNYYQKYVSGVYGAVPQIG